MESQLKGGRGNTFITLSGARAGRETLTSNGVGGPGEMLGHGIYSLPSLGGCFNGFNAENGVIACALSPWDSCLVGHLACPWPDALGGIHTSSEEAVNSSWVVKSSHVTSVSGKWWCRKNRCMWLNILMVSECYVDHVTLTSDLEMSRLFLMKNAVLNIFLLKVEHCNLQTVTLILVCCVSQGPVLYTSAWAGFCFLLSAPWTRYF